MSMLMAVTGDLLCILVGYVFVSSFGAAARRLGIIERMLYGYLAGMGLATYLMFITGWMSIRWSLTVILLPVLFVYFLLVTCARLRKIRLPELLFPRPGASEVSGKKPATGVSAICVLLYAWLALKIAMVLAQSAMLPVYAVDSWENWSLLGRFFYHEGGLALVPGQEHYFGSGYRTYTNYPLNVVLMQTFHMFLMGGQDEIFVKSSSALFYISAVGITFCAVRRYSSTVPALLAALFLSSMPLLTFHASIAYADLPLACYALGGMVFLHMYTEEPDPGLLALAGTFAALCMWTKYEGMFFALAIGVALLVHSVFSGRPLRRIWPYVLPIALVALPWQAFLFSIGKPAFRGDEAVTGAVQHLEVLYTIIDETMFSVNFALAFPFFLVITLLAFRTVAWTTLRYLYIALGSVMAMYAFVFFATEYSKWVLDLTGLNRNLMAFVPAMHFVSALAATRALGISKHKN